MTYQSPGVPLHCQQEQIVYFYSCKAAFLIQHHSLRYNYTIWKSNDRTLAYVAFTCTLSLTPGANPCCLKRLARATSPAKLYPANDLYYKWFADPWNVDGWWLVGVDGVGKRVSGSSGISLIFFYTHYSLQLIKQERKSLSLATHSS